MKLTIMVLSIFAITSLCVAAIAGTMVAEGILVCKIAASIFIGSVCILGDLSVIHLVRNWDKV